MAYTTVDKVKSMFRDIQIDLATGNPETETAVTIETVNDLIADHDAFIDGRLFDFYDVPITGTNALIIVGRISKLLVAHDIKLILESTDANTDKNKDVQGNLRDQALKLLSSIMPTWDSFSEKYIDPKVNLVDASMKEISPKGAGVMASNNGTVIIKKGGDNW